MPRNWNGRAYTFDFEDPREPVRTWRRRQPSHFVFEISSYDRLAASLKTANLSAFETPEFDVGGTTWTMIIYPEGNISRGGSNNISIYLKRKLNAANRAHVTDVSCKFFILDQMTDEYLVISDLAESQLNPRANEWGIDKALLYSDFHMASNGFMIDNKCVFGAEVFITTGIPRYSKMTMVKRISNPRIVVRMGPLGQLSEPSYSNDFTIRLDGESYDWKLELYKGGNDSGYGTHFSLYLELIDTSNHLSNGKNIFVNYQIRLQDKRTGQYTTNNLPANLFWYTSSSKSSGYPEFISNVDFFDYSKGYSAGNTFDVEVTFNSVFVLQDV